MKTLQEGNKVYKMGGVRKILSAAILSILIFTVICTSASAWEIQLNQGWNLVSLPEQQRIVNIDTVIGAIEDKVISVWLYKDGSWQIYSPSSLGLSDLEELDAGVGFWINISEPCTLAGSGLTPSSTTHLTEGWNMVGYNSDTIQPVGDALESIRGKYESVWSYQEGLWTSYQASNGSGGLTTLEPGKGYWIKVLEDCNLYLDVNIPESTKMVPSEVLSMITSITETKITFSGTHTFLNDLINGDIIVSGPTEQLANGFIRKITNIQSSGSNLIVSTSLATLEDAIQNGSAGGTINIGYDDIDMSSVPAGMTISRSETNENTIRFTINYEDEDSGISASGSIELYTDFVFNIEFEDWQCKRVYVVANAEPSADLKIDVPILSAESRFEFNIGQPIRLHPVTVWVGWVPVVFTPYVQFIAGATAEAGIHASVSAGASVSATAGVEYADGTWGFIWEFDPSFQFSPSLSFEGEIKGYVGPKFDVLVYGLAGPYMKFLPYVAYDFSTDLLDASSVSSYYYQDTNIGISSTTAEIVGGAEVKLGVNANEQLFKNAPSWEAPISFAVERVLWSETILDITGTIVDENSNPLRGVTVTATKPRHGFGSEVFTARTNSEGKFTIDNVGAGMYSPITMTKSGYENIELRNLSIRDDYDVGEITMNSLTASTGSFSGVVTDALSAQTVPGVELVFQKGLYYSQLNPIVKILQTDASGSYTFDGVQSGTYIARMKKEGYAEGTFLAQCIAGQNNRNQNGMISPLIDSSELRVVLSWGSTPSDLDSHLTGPISGSSSRFHVYYSNKGSASYSPYSALDRDDTTSYGPETITIYEQRPGVYRYSVFDYTNQNQRPSTGLYASGAQVSVYQGSTLTRTYKVSDISQNEGTLWTVFEFDSTTGRIYDVNRLTYHSGGSSSISSELVDDSHLFETLPKKTGD